MKTVNANEDTITAQHHHILWRMKVPPMGVAKRRDFWIVPAGTQILRMRHNITPYCLHGDDIVLVETPPQITLAGAPFLYRQQYRYAMHVYTMPQLSFCWAMNNRDRPPAPIFICGMGRSGSTLLANILKASPQMIVYDEPDVYTQMSSIGGKHQGLIAAITASFARHDQRLVLKQRSLVSYLIPQLHAVFPDARFVFLYRNPVDWVQSNLRMVLRYRLPEWVVRRALRPIIEPYLDVTDISQFDRMSMIEIAALLWVKFMQLGATFITEGLPILPLHYDDLITMPRETLSHVVTFCDLATDDFASLLGVSGYDSQAGTLLARGNLPKLSLTAEQVKQIDQVIDRYGWSGNARLNDLPNSRC
ncbi:MAG: sulfotransferase family protein [Anaerolineae bacterium]